MNPTSGRPDRTLISVLAVIAGLVIVALVVVFSRGAPAQIDRATPAGVVQAYSAAVLDGDEQKAADFLTPHALASCDTVGNRPAADLRVTLVSTTERQGSADVTVSIVTAEDAGPFGSSEFETREVFDLLTVDGVWKIDSAPWQLTICTTTTDAP